MTTQPESVSAQSVLAVFRCFLKLGLTCFGGPITHLAYFRREFVERRQWLDDHQYAQLLALCQFLPGPASSQLGFSIGLLRAGFPGALAAFIGFTLPSAVLMLAFALYLPALTGPLGQAAIHGLKLVAVAVVAQGLIGMSQQLCPDWPRRIIALLTASIMLTWNVAWLQLLVVAVGAIAGLRLCRSADALPAARLPLRYGTRLGWMLLGVFAILLFGLPLIAQSGDAMSSMMAAFYRAGALVFGGGHVVLPLLKEAVVDTGWISSSEFMAGYGAAQAVPGPMFSLAAYLGAILSGGHNSGLGAALALLMIFLPGLLLITAALPLWRLISEQPRAARAIAGVNATVVGLLATAFYNPVWISGITNRLDFCIALIGLLLLSVWRLSALWTVLWCISATLVTGLLQA